MNSQLWFIPVAGAWYEAFVLGGNDRDVDSIITQVLDQVLRCPAHSIDRSKRLGCKQDSLSPQPGGEVVIDNTVRLRFAGGDAGRRHARGCMKERKGKCAPCPGMQGVIASIVLLIMSCIAGASSFRLLVSVDEGVPRPPSTCACDWTIPDVALAFPIAHHPRSDGADAHDPLPAAARQGGAHCCPEHEARARLIRPFYSIVTARYHLPWTRRRKPSTCSTEWFRNA
jgi:hypothetical protein